MSVRRAALAPLLLACLCGTLAGPPAIAQTTGTASVRGRVVAADTGAPIRRALVTLAVGETIRRQVTTDREGRYQITALPAGRFTLSVGKGGYLTLEHGQRRAFEPGRPLELARGEALDGVDFALPRGAVIVGRVTDQRGQPVIGAEIGVERYQYGPGGERRLSRLPIPLQSSNDLGEFRVFGLMPGEYLVSASLRQMPSLPGQPTPTEPVEAPLQTYYPGTPNAAEAQAVALEVGAEATVQFSMVRGRLSRISGIVRDSSGQPAGGADVSLATRTSTPFGVSSRSAGSTGADGRFTIPNVPPGDHFIRVGYLARRGDTQVSELADAPVSTGGADVTGLDIRTIPGAEVSGRVTWDGRAQRGPTDTPLRVVARATDGRPEIIGFMSALLTTDRGIVGPDDTFRIASLVGTVIFDVEGVPPEWMLEAVIVNGGNAATAGVDAGTLSGDAPIEVVLTDRVTGVSGMVRNNQGESVVDYVVVVLPEDPVEPAIASRYTRTARPDQGGAFHVRALPPGRYAAVAVAALSEGTEWDPVFQATARQAARRFTLGAGETIALDLDLAP
jgi:hypothetical protein